MTTAPLHNDTVINYVEPSVSERSADRVLVLCNRGSIVASLLAMTRLAVIQNGAYWSEGSFIYSGSS